MTLAKAFSNLYFPCKVSPQLGYYRAEEFSRGGQRTLTHVENEEAVLPDRLQSQIDALNMKSPERTSLLVDLILTKAVECSASDIHFEPTNHSLEIRFRLDGVLHRVGLLTRDVAANIVGRLKVMAELLTYRQDIPQEGRLRSGRTTFGVDMRVSTFPTIHGEKAAVRLFGTGATVFDLEQIGLPGQMLEELCSLFLQRTGAIFLTGPSGSGKTTTLYACLRHLLAESHGGRHIVTIEDPVEQVLEGISQSQARPGTEFDFARGLRSLLRQDPEIIMVGEVRDPETAHIAVEAALTGHLMLSTLHAGSSCGVISRLLEMGVETYLLTSGLKGIVNQRLLRRLCPACRRQTSHGWDIGGCERCLGTGYHGRMLLAELVTIDGPLRQAILDHADTLTLERCAHSSGRPTLWSTAQEAVTQGHTTQREVTRVLGPRTVQVTS
jgi:type II secretory ATPase GspE/PulE/Tfp pilus assembly ATPase PilB-like protein